MLGLAVNNKKRMVFMETIINDMLEILKSDTGNISLGTYIREFVKNVVGKAFEVYDDNLIHSMKEKVYQIEWNSARRSKLQNFIEVVRF